MTRDRYGEGRFIDPTVGLLEGEAAGQRTPAQRATAEGSVPYAAWDQTPGREADRSEPTYYDRPVLKEPVWIWAVPAYFYAGGAAGAASVLGAAAQLAGGGEMRALVARCRLIAAAGTAAGAGLLVYDLGRPERFLNMLRVFRPTSAMSMGSWILAGAGSASGLAAVLGRSGGARGAGDAAGLAAGLLGMPLAGYTAVLLADTAVPLWQQSRRALPALFVASAMSAAASLLELGDLDHRERRTVAVFGTAGKVAEMGAAAAVERELRSVDGLVHRLETGRAGSLWRFAKVASAASGALSLFGGRSRRGRVAAGVLGSAASVALRFAVFHAGKASARDPRDTFRQQREGRGAAEVTRTAAVTGPGGRRALD